MFYLSISLYIFGFSSLLPQPSHANAILEAAKLASDRAWGGVSDAQATARIISAALVPLFGIRWSKKSIVAVDTRPVSRWANQLLGRVRNSPLPRADYDRVGDLFKLAYLAPADFPPGM